MEELEKEVKEIEARIAKIELLCQDFGKRIDQLEDKGFDTGVYFDGCNEADTEYIIGKPIKKEGE